MKNLALINPENVSENEANGYNVREAVRAVVIDNDNKIALLYVAKEDYYKLPGGGIEELEDKETALERECLEEIGCKVEVIDEVGEVIEYRKMFQLKQISYCYLAKIVGEKGESEFTDEERDKDFKQVWVPLEESLNTINQSNASSIEGKDYIVPRDKIFLKVASELINK
jgi:8-oxo-dGTP diphosphatase